MARKGVGEIRFHARYETRTSKWTAALSKAVPDRESFAIYDLLARISRNCDRKAFEYAGLDGKQMHERAARFVCATLGVKPVKFGETVRAPPPPWI